MQAQIYQDAVAQIDYTPTVDRSGGDIVLLPDGRVGVVKGSGLKAGELGAVYTKGVFTINKAAGITLLEGQQAWWDKASAWASYTGGFPIGMVVYGDAISTDDQVIVEINAEARPIIEQGKGVWAREATDGLGVTDEDGVVKLAFDDVAELAQAAYVSDKTVDADDKPIFEAWVGVFDQGDDVALDMNVGLASASHATDFDAITAFAAIHLDGNSLRIRPQSDDDATDVAPFDSTIDAVLGTYFFLQIDARNKDDVKFYINGVLVANQNPFVLTNYAGGLAAIAHIEKGNNDTAADVRLHGLKVRTGLS